MMNAIKFHKQIESNDIHVDGLEKFKGRNAEIIILIDDSSKDDLQKRRDEAFKIIDSFSGDVENWNREELYDR